MKKSETQRTLIKIRTGRRTRDYWALFKLCCLGFIPVVFIGSCQVTLCKVKHSRMSWTQCMLPGWEKGK